MKMLERNCSQPARVSDDLCQTRLIKLGAKQSDKNPIPQLADVDTSTDVDLLRHMVMRKKEQPSDVSPN